MQTPQRKAPWMTQAKNLGSSCCDLILETVSEWQEYTLDGMLAHTHSPLRAIYRNSTQTAKSLELNHGAMEQ